MRDWRTLTPAEVLDAFPALTINQIGYVIGATRRNGEIDRRRVITLIKDGRLPLIDPDPTLSIGRWTVSQASVRGYLDGNPQLRRAS